MQTALVVIERAFSKIGVRSAETALTASEVQDGLDALNDLLAEWGIDGTIKEAVPVKEVNDILQIPRYCFGALKSNLALRLGNEYGRKISPVLLNEAKSSLAVLLRRAVNLAEIKFPSTLPVGSGNYIDYNSDSDFFPSDDKRNF